jgi:tight adherence protein B
MTLAVSAMRIAAEAGGGSLPLVLIFALLCMEPTDMGKLFTMQIGWAMLVIVAVLELLGVVLMRKIVAIDV